MLYGVVEIPYPSFAIDSFLGVSLKPKSHSHQNPRHDYRLAVHIESGFLLLARRAEVGCGGAIAVDRPRLPLPMNETTAA